MVVEIWKPVDGFENYSVSNFGRIKSDSRRAKGKILRPKLDRYGYYHLGLSKEGKRKWFTIHRLVASAFWHDREGGDQINHIDGNKTNNRLGNLEWVTCKQNNRHAWDIGLCEKHRFSFCEYAKKNFRKPVNQYDLTGNLINRWDGLRVAARGLGIHESRVRDVLRGKFKQTRGFVFRYAS